MSNRTGFIFDKDGTLFNTEWISNMVREEMQREFHFALTDEEVFGMKGLGGPELRSYMERLFPEHPTMNLVDEYVRRSRERQMSELQLMKGTVEILTYLKSRGFLIAIASSANRDRIEQQLAITGIASYFDAIVSSEDVSHSKPAPDAFLTAAQKLGLSPASCYAAEDSPNGIRSAHAAGCFTILIPDQVPVTPEMEAYYDDLSEDFLEVIDKLKRGVF